MFAKYREGALLSRTMHANTHMHTYTKGEKRGEEEEEMVELGVTGRKPILSTTSTKNFSIFHLNKMLTQIPLK